MRNSNSSILPDMPIYVIEVSLDKGKTWELVQSYGMYITKQRCESRARKDTIWHRENLTAVAWSYGWLFRTREYRPVPALESKP